MKPLPFAFLIFAFVARAAWGEIATLSATSVATPTPTPTAYDAQNPLVFSLRTAYSSTSAKVSYGSAFVVSPTGLLATNYHVVQSQINQSRGYKLYLQVQGQSDEARITAIDVIHDLALVKVSRNFPGIVPLGRGEHAIGEKTYSVGQPEDLNMSVVEGTFNGIRQFAPYEQIVLSSPINPGMSGGPTLDSNYHLLGVNVSVLRDAQNLSFAVPGHFVAELYQASAKHDHSALTPEQLRHQVVQQLEQASNEITQHWLETSAPRLMGEWSVMAAAPQMKCWQKPEKDLPFKDSNEVSRELDRCESDFWMTPKDELRIGKLSIEYLLLQHRDRNQKAFYRNLNEGYAKLGSLSMRDEEYTLPACTDQILNNAHHVRLKAHFCTAGFKSYPSLVSCSMKVATLDDSETSALMAFRFTGLPPAACRKVVEQILNRFEKGANAHP